MLIFWDAKLSSRNLVSSFAVTTILIVLFFCQASACIPFKFTMYEHPSDQTYKCFKHQHKCLQLYIYFRAV